MITNYFKILVYKNGKIDEIIPIESYASYPDESNLISFIGTYRTYEKITKEEYNKIIIIKKLLEIDELIEMTKTKTNIATDDKIKILKKCIDDLLKISHDGKTNIEDYGEINRLLNKATFRLYQL